MLSKRKLSKLLNNSIWIVPKETLIAYSLNGEVITPVKDQTIWIIDSCKDNYIFGTSYLTLNGVFISKSKIIGSVTPLGNVLFTFYTDNNITTGSGKFLKLDNEYKFLMQMNTFNNSSGNITGLSHWSYMLRITHCDQEYYHIPGTKISIDELIKTK